MGYLHGGARGAALQSNVLSDRLDLAARQFSDRSGLAAVRPTKVRSINFPRTFRRRELYGELRRLPELYCGFQRGRERGPYTVSGRMLAAGWAAGTPLLLLQSSLGLEFDDRNEILLRNPRLPPFLNEVTLRNLRLNQSAVDLILRRHGNDVSLQVLRNEGQIRVAAVYSSKSTRPGARRRKSHWDNSLVSIDRLL